VVTRAAAQSREIIVELERLGAEPLALPTIETAPPVNWAALDNALENLDSYDGFIFTSINGVKSFFHRAEQRAITPALNERQWLCAIGPATADALTRRGWAPTIMPREYVAESVVAALKSRNLSGQRILVPRAAVARDVIPSELRRLGATVEVVETYQTVIPHESRRLAEELFPPSGHKRVDAVLFTSSSTAENLAKLLGETYRERLSGVALAAIGPVTAETLQRLGLDVAVAAKKYTTSGLIDALAHYFSG
jgi:uroporphyrinogen III methyltransferase/synthase